MAAYDFRQLSSRDFEELTRDLLQAEWNVALEAFKSGRDQGIDLRYAPAHGGRTIIQCKHFAVSGYSKLLAHLRSSELPKVGKLKPDRYVLVTSVELTVKNKDAIKELFEPFIQSTDDVKGANDLDGLLRRHQEVERANFKLWLTNTEVLERVLHNAQACQTEFEVDRVLRKLPIFVQSAAFPRAQEILRNSSVLVVSGAPGIGKTTLAEMLLYAHLEQGYEPVVVQSDIKEGKALFKSKRQQIFYFDDFLGQTFLGESRNPGGLNRDLALVDFVEMLKATGRSRFILTTREHLLQGASASSERLRHSSLLDHRCVLELADYSKGQRARILYNHLYFSDLPREYKEQVLRDDFFLEVIAHKHFNPRLIEWLSAPTRLREVPSAEYQGHIRKLLANPQAIWSHAFNSQISPSSRNVLLALYSLGEWCELSELEPAWLALQIHTATKYNRPADPRDYQQSLKELDNAFVTYRSGHVTFLNPSVRELVAAEIRDCPEHGIDLMTSAVRFRQIRTICELAERQGNVTVRAILGENLKNYAKNVARLLHTPHIRWKKDATGTTVGSNVDLPLEQRLAHIAKISDATQSLPLIEILERETRALVQKYAAGRIDLDDATSLIEALDELSWLKPRGGAALQRIVLDAILADLRIVWASQLTALFDCKEEVSCWSTADSVKVDAALADYRVRGCAREIDECDDVSACENLKDELDTLAKKAGVSFDRDIDWINERIGEMPDDAKPDHGAGFSIGSRTLSDVRDDGEESIRDMFQTLVG